MGDKGKEKAPNKDGKAVHAGPPPYIPPPPYTYYCYNSIYTPYYCQPVMYYPQPCQFVQMPGKQGCNCGCKGRKKKEVKEEKPKPKVMVPHPTFWNPRQPPKNRFKS